MIGVECPLLAHNGHGVMSELSPLSAPNQTFANASDFMGVRIMR
jgi:hypothetical protein